MSEQNGCPNCAALREQVERLTLALRDINDVFGRTGESACVMGEIAVEALSATPTPPTDAATCPMCKNLHLVWIGRADETVLYEIPCPTCQPQRKEGESDDQ